MWDETWELEAVERRHVASLLVAVVNRLRDWELVCSEHWYRIPLARAPRRIGADYLAFYHTKVFPGLRWTITYYAPVERYSLVPRRALLPSEPNHPRSETLYWKIEIGPLVALPRPIPSHRLRRVTFIPTTLARLFQAQEINDLWVKETTGDRLRGVWQVRESTGSLRPGYACHAPVPVAG